MESTDDLTDEMQVHVGDVEAEAGTSLDEEEVGAMREEDLVANETIPVELTDTVMGMNLEVNPVTEKLDGSQGSKAEPFIGMVFRSAVASYRFYIEYARHVGFGVRKKVCRLSKINRELIAVWYVCTREGKSVVNEKSGSSQSTRIGCPAALKVKRMTNKEWKVTHFEKQHNHDLDLENACFFRSHVNKSRMLRKNRITNKESLRCKGTKLVFVEQPANQEGGCENFSDWGQRKFFAPADAHAIHMLFMHMHTKNPAFFYAVDFDSEQHLKNVFWADAKSKVACTHFGDVITFDTTCLTDGYKVPLISFVGTNHHGRSILLGCALLADLSASSFVWLCKTWLDAVSGKPPKAIITNYNMEIAAAVMHVFPKAHHRFCLWQILRMFPERLGDVCDAHENFLGKLNKCIFDSTTDDEFERKWCKLTHRFGLENEEWLQKLHKDRQKWVPLYLKDTFFAGMSISRRDESISSMFHEHISRETSLKEFLLKYELALESKYEDEAQEDLQSFHSKPKKRTYISPFELQLANVYTRNMFEKFQAEVLGISSVSATKSEENGDIAIYKVKAYEVQDDKRNRRIIEKEYRVEWNARMRRICCVCRLFEFKGYLCRHALVVFLALGILEIPSHYILKRWTKDAKSRNVLDEGYGVRGDCSVAQRFNDICLRSFKFAEEASVSKRSYDVALLALQEAFRKVTQANNNVGKCGQRNYSHTGGLGAMSSLSNLHAFNTVYVANDKFNSSFKNDASKQDNNLCGGQMQLDQTATQCEEMFSGAANLTNRQHITEVVPPLHGDSEEPMVLLA